MADENIQAAPTDEAAIPPPEAPSDGEAAAPPRLDRGEDGIPLSTPPAPAPAAIAAPAVSTKKDTSASTEPKDVLREIAETVVFVVVLVLLLKTFIAEAFVIPTGSMATTLWGYQKVVTCPQCEFVFPVNCSSQSDPSNRHPQDVVGCTCPNCLVNINFPNPKDNPPWNSGDRVLVFKAWFDSGLPGGRAKRFDVVVFKFPVEPQQNGQAMNYIKRLVGLPEETIAIAGGQLFVYPGKPDDPPRQNIPPPPRDPITNEEIFYGPSNNFAWPEDREAETMFKAGRFTIIRKAPDKMLTLRRIVFDNDHLARDLVGADQARWQPAGTWKGDSPTLAKSFSHGGEEFSWLRYQHLLRGNDKPQLIMDVMGYNTGRPLARDPLGSNWVGDLMLECEIQADQAGGEVWLELSRGGDRFQARFDLANGMCRLFRLANGAEPKELAQRETAVKGPGKHQVTFANFDERLTVWVNGELPFGPGVEYPSSGETGSDNKNDLQPASIAAKGKGVSVSHLKLWRDTFYTTGGPDLKTLYIYKNHFLCLGDNSPESSDGRMWGMVPERLMLGRALMVYFPFRFPYWPLNLPANRVGVIH